jgi:hypothetical protein
VGRFRQFVTAWDNGFTIDAGAGIHLKVNNGMGLQMPSDAGAVYEQGWETTWSGTLPTNLQSWSEQLTQCPDRSWNSGDDKEPINCVTWIAVYAFCIWDGGYLPSEAEWDYVAQGGPGDGGATRVPVVEPVDLHVHRLRTRELRRRGRRGILQRRGWAERGRLGFSHGRRRVGSLRSGRQRVGVDAGLMLAWLREALLRLRERRGLHQPLPARRQLPRPSVVCTRSPSLRAPGRSAGGEHRSTLRAPLALISSMRVPAPPRFHVASVQCSRASQQRSRVNSWCVMVCRPGFGSSLLSWYRTRSRDRRVIA